MVGAAATEVIAPAVLLVHGGLGEDLDADRFWVQPGIAAGLRAVGFTVIAPDHNTAPASWSAAASQVAGHITAPVSVVAGSNGVSVAVRLALEHRHLVDRLVLLWPATAGDPVLDATMPETVGHLLDGDTLRGVIDDELAALDVPTVVMASDPPDPYHALHTVEQLVKLIPQATRIPDGFPESPRPDFKAQCGRFLDALVPYLG